MADHQSISKWTPTRERLNFVHMTSDVDYNLSKTCVATHSRASLKTEIKRIFLKKMGTDPRKT